MHWIAIVGGGWGLVTVIAFIQVIRLSYRIEARSPQLARKPGDLPRKANIVATVTNWRVARDPDTQALRRRMLRLLAAILAGYGAFTLFLVSQGAFDR